MTLSNPNPTPDLKPTCVILLTLKVKHQLDDALGSSSNWR